jgi:hypothetical protein
MPFTITGATAGAASTTGNWATFSYTVTATSNTTIMITGDYLTYTATPNTIHALPLSEPSEDELAERIRRDREWQARERERDARRRTAAEAAEQLLLSALNAEQAASYRANKIFEVVGSHGGRYRINYGTAGNVDALTPNGVFIGALCCHPQGGLPTPDVMLAQMLHLATDEPGFLRTANVHRGHRPAIGAVAA